MTLEPDPFVEMVDDDNPWIEGLFFAFVLGLIIALARLFGGLLLSASLPPSDAVLETLAISLKQFLSATPAQQASAEASLRQLWPLLTPLFNYGNGWLGLLGLIVTPLAFIGQWLLYASISHAAARLLGGSGSLSQTLGALALSMAPRILLVATVVPFASVSALLLHSWGLLIAYRGLEVAHDLPPGKATAAALVPLLLGALLFLLAAVLGIGLFSLTGGGI
ncbi:MAG: YIP1 family protein [Chloroflexi bacterium]|nr:YIP1 family protein [Chloroflexota bacterium]